MEEKQVKSRWPALFSERQIQAEFQRIVTTDLLSSFLDGLDGLAPRLLEVYKGASRTGKKQALKSILDCLEKDDTNERRRTAALFGLSHYMSGEKQANVIRMCDAHGDTL
ncbi:Phosphoribosylglycinamide formyltransferase [Dissostichus eleginoides]|uniref:Phosphoribosylglycinamide formyltransferase n=1 Tax=Dissostichus eleginoides TaxID=100907 RepID=A0AAD9BB58_DISEL|nr:Phosphoribosylglycinamide formyltransferase [Dissostichus eleginoides]